MSVCKWPTTVAVEASVTLVVVMAVVMMKVTRSLY